MKRVLAVLLFDLLCSAAWSASIEWATVGDAGNLPDDVWPPNVVSIAPDARVLHGAVDHLYRIGKYEVTNAQYAEFLNAVARDDPHELYAEDMDPQNVRPDFYPVGGIIRQGAPGEFTYQLVPGRERWPVTNVSFWNAIRFANWVHNGQPVGSQGTTKTEDGAYTITRAGMNDNSIIRNPNAKVFLPSEDEWYKAAYFKGGGVDAGFWEFATGSDEPPIAEDPPGTVSAAYRQSIRKPDRPLHIVFEPTDVGAYVNSPSPLGTFDQAGNAMEWNDTIHVSLNGQPERGARGGHFAAEVEFVSASRTSPDWLERTIMRYLPWGNDPFLVNPFMGFRLASVYVLPGDVNQNGSLDEDDLNGLTQQVRDRSHDTWYDLTEDGHVDEADRETWVHDLKRTYFGDANLDGSFDSTDLVTAIQAGEYEDAVPLNSHWSTGDWNGDGEFTSVDLVVALADGGYEQGPRFVASAVPEPQSIMLLAASAIGAAIVSRSRQKPV
jgi:formylglycine-generating enzyme required for sulfatase activity